MVDSKFGLGSGDGMENTCREAERQQNTADTAPISTAIIETVSEASQLRLNVWTQIYRLVAETCYADLSAYQVQDTSRFTLQLAASSSESICAVRITTFISLQHCFVC